MTYAELLTQYIKKSGLTLGEIVMKLNFKGINIDRSYISKLKNGTKPPASEDVTRALAEVTDGDPEQLILAGYIEKAPKEVQKLLSEASSIEETINNAITSLIESVTDPNGLIYEDTRQMLIKFFEKRGFSIDESTFMKYPHEYKYFLDRTSIETRLGILQMITSLAIEHSISPQKLLIKKEDEDNYSELGRFKKIIRVPILGNIPAGQPITTEENIIEWETIPNPGNYKGGELFILIVKGDSMIGSRIYEGDKVLVRVQPEVENGEIAVVNVNGYDATLKRVKKTENGQVILYPDNPKYEPIFLADTSARICGKVIQVMFDPNKK